MFSQRFSPCSLRSIRKVLQAKSGRCFSEPEESFCGNLRVEGDEECDAGLLGSEDNDPCCDKVCKLRRNQGAVCRCVWYLQVLMMVHVQGKLLYFKRDAFPSHSQYQHALYYTKILNHLTISVPFSHTFCCIYFLRNSN